jgi:putative endopeptidase
MNLLSRRLILAALCLSLITLSLASGPPSRAKVTESEPAPPGLFVNSPQTTSASGFDVSNLDRTANACQDFNQFANGCFIAKNQIPGAYSRWGRFEVLGEQNLDALHEILDGLLKKKNHTAGSNEQKVADF